MNDLVCLKLQYFIDCLVPRTMRKSHVSKVSKVFFLSFAGHYSSVSFAFQRCQVHIWSFIADWHSFSSVWITQTFTLNPTKRLRNEVQCDHLKKKSDHSHMKFVYEIFCKARLRNSTNDGRASVVQMFHSCGVLYPSLKADSMTWAICSRKKWVKESFHSG